MQFRENKFYKDSKTFKNEINTCLKLVLELGEIFPQPLFLEVLNIPPSFVICVLYYKEMAYLRITVESPENI